MIKSLTLYPNSLDTKEVESSISDVLNSMKNQRGLLSITISEGSLMSPGGPPAYSHVVESIWDSLESFMAWAQNRSSEENAHKDYLLENGVALLFYEVKDLT
jgi:heme-degrading monooxygenase HmoA